LARAAVGFVALGAVLRITKYLQDHSLWLDEATVALSIGRRSLAGLAAPLDYDQLAPVPWLWVQKLLVSVAGMDEMVLRFPALVAGIVLPWLVWRAGVHLVGEWGALIACAVTAFSATLMFHSVEAKPYSVDALGTAVLLLVGGQVLSRSPGDHRLHLLGAIGVVAALSSFPSIIILAGIGAALTVRAVLARDQRTLVITLGWSVAWIAAFAIPQMLLYRATGSGPVMQDFWRPALARLGEAGLFERTSSAVNALLSTLVVRPVWPGTELYLAILLFGAWTIAHKRGVVTMLMVLGPLGFAALAWLLDQLPAFDRLLLFAAPILALIFGVAIAQVIHYIPFRSRRFGVAALVMLLGGLLVVEAVEGIARPKPSGGRELVRLVPPGSSVWLTRATSPIWAFYTTDWQWVDTLRLDWFAAIHREPDLARRLERPAREPSLPELPWWTERIALPSGLRSEAGRTQGGDAVDAWAQDEVSRLHALVGSRGWMLITHSEALEMDALRRALDLEGLRVEHEVILKRSTLWLVSRSARYAPSARSTSSTEAQR
jgi:hypothetical protein